MSSNNVMTYLINLPYPLNCMPVEAQKKWATVFKMIDDANKTHGIKY